MFTEHRASPTAFMAVLFAVAAAAIALPPPPPVLVPSHLTDSTAGTRT
jgi:hypothetical protein